jgi:hypothetical protein
LRRGGLDDWKGILFLAFRERPPGKVVEDVDVFGPAPDRSERSGEGHRPPAA